MSVTNCLVQISDMSRNASNGEFGNFDEISPKINTRVKMTNLTKFRRRGLSLRERGTDEAAILTNPANSARMVLQRKFVKFAILAKFAVFVKIAASSVPHSRAQSLFGEISSNSPCVLVEFTGYRQIRQVNMGNLCV